MSGSDRKVLTAPPAVIKVATEMFARGQFQELVRLATAWSAQYPRSPEVFTSLGLALRALGECHQAEQALRRAARLLPKSAVTMNNHGVALRDVGRQQDAEAVFRASVAIDPQYSIGYNNLGNALQSQFKLGAAISAYERAVEIRPDYAEAWNNLANIRRLEKNYGLAQICYRRVLALRPEWVAPWIELGNMYQEIGRVDDAEAAYQSGLERVRDQSGRELLRGHLAQWCRFTCDWIGLSALDDAHLHASDKGILPPFGALSFSDNPARQLEGTRAYVKRRYGSAHETLPAVPATAGQRLRIGYFGADFHDHATAYLIAGLLRTHDRSKYEVSVFSYGAQREGEWRARASRDVEKFYDVAGHSDNEIVRAARSEQLDIAIDLKGHTAGSRLNLFARGLAPTQISYLGYPGGLSVPFIDYIVADPTVIPSSARAHYDEKIIFMPHCYQPNDNLRQISSRPITRDDFNLPRNAVVFCCLNHSYKISEARFATWMRLLKSVPDSVLWLFASSPRAANNLQSAAARFGVDGTRLIFASHVPHAEHLARYRLADLFLDTDCINAHTTASDALWAGLPIVTRVGKKFAARVAASLLTALECPELIVDTEEAYLSLALELALNPPRLAEIKRKVFVNRLSAPLFDTELYARHFELGLAMAHEARVRGEPQDIFVPDLSDMMQSQPEAY